MFAKKHILHPVPTITYHSTMMSCIGMTGICSDLRSLPLILELWYTTPQLVREHGNRTKIPRWTILGRRTWTELWFVSVIEKATTPLLLVYFSPANTQCEWDPTVHPTRTVPYGTKILIRNKLWPVYGEKQNRNNHGTLLAHFSGHIVDSERCGIRYQTDHLEDPAIVKHFR